MIERTERPRAGGDRPATTAPQPRSPSPAFPRDGHDGSGAGSNGEGVAPCDAFALLGNETRMAILRGLRAARDPFAPSADDALSFSALRERVGMDDPGQFNYHLNRLVGQFVRRTDEGYVLRADAVGLVDAVAGGATAGADDRRADADEPCPLCGAAVEVVYENPTLTVRCTACRGARLGGAAPDGTLLSSSTFPPAGLAGRDGQELWDALFVHLARRAFGFLRGVCPGCSAPTTTAVDACPDRDGGGIREQRGTARTVTATVRCATCTAAWRFPARVAALLHPEVVGFFHARGVDADGGLTLDAYNRLLGAREVVRSTDPVELEVAVEVAGDVLAVTIDGRLCVIDVRS